MASKPRKTISMLTHEDKVLRDLYSQANIPTDQYPHRQDDLDNLVDSWNLICGRDESTSDLLHYMVTKRKKKLWVTLGRTNCERLENIRAGLSEHELKILDTIHEELPIASDRFALDSELSDTLQKEFAKRTGRIFPPMMLAAAMIRRRKVGALATLKPSKSVPDSPFADIDKVANL